MLFRSGVSEYPNLASYLNVAKRRNVVKESSVAATVLGAAIAVAVLVVSETPILFPAILLLAIVAGVTIWNRRKPLPTPAEILRKEASVVAEQMSEALERGRLHRDLGQPAIAVLEECSRSWISVHSTLDAAFWRSQGLPNHYKSVRTQTLAAADRAMDEAILVFRNLLPDNPRNPDVKGMVGEVIQEAIFGSVKQSKHLPIGFEQVRLIAEKLQDLDQAVASVGKQAQEEFGPLMDVGAAGALDLAIGELKTIQVAETELRQNLRG